MAQCATWLALLLLLVLLGPMPALTQTESLHETFLWQHVDYPKTKSKLDARRYCNLMMQRRGMTATVCKPSNTFIHGEHLDVDAIFSNAGTNYSENYYYSTFGFPITVCRFVGDSQSPPCNYRGRKRIKIVRLACINGEPVHLIAPL